MRLPLPGCLPGRYAGRQVSIGSGVLMLGRGAALKEVQVWL
jgi:hypothetical protein